MNTFKKTLLCAIALPLALGSASALAFGDNGGHHGGKDKRGGMCGMQSGKHIFRQLNLSDEQKTELKEQRKANKEEMKANRGEHKPEMMEQRAQMESLLLADNFDEAAVRDLAQKMANQQVEHRVDMAEKRHQMLSVLTPEQKAELQTLKADKMAQCQAKMTERHNQNS